MKKEKKCVIKKDIIQEIYFLGKDEEYMEKKNEKGKIVKKVLGKVVVVAIVAMMILSTAGTLIYALMS